MSGTPEAHQPPTEAAQGAPERNKAALLRDRLEAAEAAAKPPPDGYKGFPREDGGGRLGSRIRDG